MRIGTSSSARHADVVIITNSKRTTIIIILVGGNERYCVWYLTVMYSKEHLRELVCIVYFYIWTFVTITITITINMNCSMTLYIRVTDGIDIVCTLLNRKIHVERRKWTKAHYLPISRRKIISVYDCCTHNHTRVWATAAAAETAATVVLW